MAENTRNNGGNGNNPNGGGSWWETIASVVAGIVAAGTAYAIYSRQDGSRPPSVSDSASSQRNGTLSSGTRSNCPSNELVGREDTSSRFQKNRR